MGITISFRDIFLFGMFVALASNRTIHFYNVVLPFYYDFYKFPNYVEVSLVFTFCCLIGLFYGGLAILIDKMVKQSHSFILHHVVYYVNAFFTLLFAAVMIAISIIGLLLS